MSNHIIKLFLKVRKIIFYISLVSAFIVGFYPLGSFLESEVYKWIVTQYENIPILARLLDVQGMLVDKMVATTVPLFTTWALVFFIYGAMDDIKGNKIASISPVLSWFTGGTGAFVAILGCISLGISFYGLAFHGMTNAIIAALIFGVLIIISGMFMKYAATPAIKGREWIHNKAKHFGVIYALLAAAAYIYTIATDPVQLWNAVHEAYIMR